MTEQDKVRHLLRRFGFGASIQEMDAFSPLGAEGTLRKLIDFVQEPETVHPYRFLFNDANERDIGTYAVKMWWSYQMATTRTPLREKMALFWHDHFAIHEDDAGDPLMILDYVHLLRKDPLGKFTDIIHEMARTPAFMEMLTMRGSYKVAPNENFARELMELYTIGIGNYTEKDVKEAAKSFTGWSYDSLYYREDWNDAKRLKVTAEGQMPLASFAFYPAFHDGGPKTILGATKPFSGEEVIEVMVKHDKCAELICGKLWEYFAGSPAEKSVLIALVSEYRKTGGSIRAILYQIGRHPAFYSDKVVRAKIKNPVEHHIGILRAMDSPSWLPAKVGLNRPSNERIKKETIDQLGGLAYHIGQAGMNLLAAPNVAGWDWGENWINTNTMVWRVQFEGIYTWELKDKAKNEWGSASGGKSFTDAVKAMNVKTPEQIAAAVCKVFDVTVDQKATETLVAQIKKTGGMDPLNSGKESWFFGQIWGAFKLLKASPAFHVH